MNRSEDELRVDGRYVECWKTEFTLSDNEVSVRYVGGSCEDVVSLGVGSALMVFCIGKELCSCRLI